MKKNIIAIDGYASTGKSSLAKRLSLHLNYIYINSGSMYRAITFFALKKGMVPLNKENIRSLINLLPEIKLDYRINNLTGFSEIYLNNINIEAEIKTLKVSEYVSLVAEISEIRKHVVKIQKSFQNRGGLVMDGRDIGSVVFPNADVKFYLDASLKERSERRWRELQKTENVSLDDVKNDLYKRDQNDVNREFSPLIKPKNSIIVNTDNLSIDKVVDKMIKIIDQVSHN